MNMKMVRVALAGMLTVFIHSQAASAAEIADATAESPLRCRYQAWSPMTNGVIECTVIADTVTIYKVAFNRGHCPARFDDAEAYRVYLNFWGDTADNRRWWQNQEYRGTYPYGKVIRIEASGSCGEIKVLDYAIDTDAGRWTWTISR
jgi:hypothetical protein